MTAQTEERNMKLRVGVDLGGMSAKLGVVNENNEIVDRKVIPTEKGITFEETIAKLADGILSLGDVGIVGFGVPSRDIPVYIANDADSATVGEYFQGAGRGYQSVLMLTLGTGVGGGFIYNGHLYRGGNGCGFEPGHMTIRMDGVPCTCGTKGCLESYASASAIIRELSNSENPALKAFIAENGGKPTARMLFDAVRLGNAAAQDILDDYVKALAVGIGSLVTILRPQIVLLGGGVSAAGDLLYRPLRAQMKDTVFGYDVIGCPEIVPATLGNDAGIIGAAMLDHVLL